MGHNKGLESSARPDRRSATSSVQGLGPRDPPADPDPEFEVCFAVVNRLDSGAGHGSCDGLCQRCNGLTVQRYRTACTYSNSQNPRWVLIGPAVLRIFTGTLFCHHAPQWTAVRLARCLFHHWTAFIDTPLHGRVSHLTVSGHETRAFRIEASVDGPGWSWLEAKKKQVKIRKRPIQG